MNDPQEAVARLMDQSSRTVVCAAFAVNTVMRSVHILSGLLFTCCSFLGFTTYEFNQKRIVLAQVL